MRVAGIIAAVIITVVILISASFYVHVRADEQGGLIGFQDDDLATPSFALAPMPDTTIPGPLTSVPIKSSNFNLFWNITEDIYAGYGGALKLSIENKNSGALFVYGFGLKWVDSGALYDRNSSVTIEPGERSEIGLLVFRAPSAGHEPYQIMVKSAVSNPAGTQWYDNGAVFSTTNTAFIKQLGFPRDPTITTNAVVHYDRVNEKVDTGVVSSVVATVRNEQPGPYSVLQVVGAYEWVAGHIEYVTETSGDYWQSAGETLALGSGDCEDHAILLCSIIDALGGTSRVNIIQEHAFPTVYIGPTVSDLNSAQAAAASYYGLAPSELDLTYLQDLDGFWMVADTTGFPFAGGLPANSEPTTADGEWTVLSDYMVCIDVTGRPATDVLDIF